MGSFTPQVHSRPKLSLRRARILLCQLCVFLAFAGIFVATTTTLLPPRFKTMYLGGATPGITPPPLPKFWPRGAVRAQTRCDQGRLDR